MKTYFSDCFEVSADLLRQHGAFNVSLVTDLPLFIDPFLLFNSKKKRYRKLHDEMIQYLVFLREKSRSGAMDPGLLKAWYHFPEVKQNWLGFTTTGNAGSGLGSKFAAALHENLNQLFPDFGDEAARKVTRGAHLEKLCLVRQGVGRDNISDFTTNLIKGYLCEYTQEFAAKHIEARHRRSFTVAQAYFNYVTETWCPESFELPAWNGDFVLLTPNDLLTRDDTWINKSDLIQDFEDLPAAVPDVQLRAQVNNYFQSVLRRAGNKEPSQKEKAGAAFHTLQRYPQLVDYYIRLKEDTGDRAESISADKVDRSDVVFVAQIRAFQQALADQTLFYLTGGDTYAEALDRVRYLKDMIENKGCHTIFYDGGKPVQREQDVHVMFRLVWIGTSSDVTREANDGRGPADFKISRGATDKTIVEFKLAKNTSLERNLIKQAEIYQKAGDARHAIKVIVFFTEAEESKVSRILTKLKLHGREDIVQIDARSDNKPSGSKA